MAQFVWHINGQLIRLIKCLVTIFYLFWDVESARVSLSQELINEREEPSKAGSCGSEVFKSWFSCFHFTAHEPLKPCSS